jgi:hypothetical protein
MNSADLARDLAELNVRPAAATGIRSMADWQRGRNETAVLDAKLQLRRPKKPRRSARRSPTVDVRAAIETVERVAAEEGVTLATEVRCDYSDAPGTSPRERAMRAAGVTL